MTQYRWIVIAFAFLGIIITYLDRTALSYAISPLKDTFDLSNADFGMVAAAFGFGYLFMTVIGGILVDRYGSRKIWSVFAILWSISCTFIGLAMGFAWLVIFRFLLGFTEGPSFPSFNRVCADWLPVSERARALAFGLAAVPFASVIGAPLLSSMVAHLGWRYMFIILGIAGVIWAFVWWFVFRDKPDTSRFVSAGELEHIKEELVTEKVVAHTAVEHKTTWRFMLCNRTFIVNNYAFFTFGYLLFFAVTWLPGYLEQTYGINVKAVGWFLVLPWLLATILLIAGGSISDYLWHKTHHIRTARSHIIWICQIASALCFIPVVLTHSLPVAIAGISLGVGLGLMPNAAFYALNADLARDRAATSLGLMNFSFALSGILAPLITGILSDMTGNFASAFLLLIILTLTSALGIIFFHHPDRALEQKVKY